MQIGEMKARPPHLSFTTKSVEDRNASIEAGHPVFKNVDYVNITPPGSKDSVSKPVDEWLTISDQQVREERLPATWAEAFRSAYAHWKRGEELPPTGIPLTMWPAISASELAACKSVHVLTVEDLAAANEETKRRIGMGSVALVQRAQSYLAASSGPGKLVAENLALAEKVTALTLRNSEVEERIKRLEEALPATASPVKSEVPEDNLERKL